MPVRARTLLLALAAAIAAAPAHAQPVPAAPAPAGEFTPGSGGWLTYRNGSFGFHIDFPPALLTPVERLAGDAGMRFAGPSANLEVFTFPDAGGNDPAPLRAALRRLADVTYTAAGNSWVVASGYAGSRVFYEKYFFSMGRIVGFRLTFETAQRPIFGPVVERMEDSFGP